MLDPLFKMASMAFSLRLSFLVLFFFFAQSIQGKTVPSASSPIPGSDSPSPAPSPSHGPKSDQTVPPPSLMPSPSRSYSPPPSDDQPEEFYSPQHVRWCTTSLAELSFCSDVLPSLSVKGEQVWSCVIRSSPIACMDAIGQGEAEIINLEAGLAYYAFINKSMKAIMTERIDRGVAYDVVAVVKKDLCENNEFLTLSSLRGMRSCHGAYWSAAGWDIPLETLINAKAIDPQSVEEGTGISPDMSLVSDFFSKSCAPGDKGSRRVCTGCLTQEGEGPCDDSDPFFGSIGAFRCLMEDAGDVAFTRTPVVTKFSVAGLLEQKWSREPASQYMFLCPGGGCSPVSDNPSYFNCTLGKVAANVIMTRNSISEREKQIIIERLEHAGTVAKWTKALYFGQNAHEYLLSFSAVGLIPVDHLTRKVLGLAGIAAENIRNLNQPGLENTDDSSHSGSDRLWWRWSHLVTSLVTFVTLLLLLLWTI